MSAVTIEPALEIPDNGSHKAAGAAFLAQVNATFERWSREGPEQWM